MTNPSPMNQTCKCGRPDLHYKFENGECPVPTKESPEAWEESIDKKCDEFMNKFGDSEIDDIVEFAISEIYQARLQAKEEIKEMVKRMEKESRTPKLLPNGKDASEWVYTSGYNQALEDILANL